MMQNVRFLQWQHAQETTNGLLQTRATALERYTYYLRLLGPGARTRRPSRPTFTAGPARADRGRTSPTPTARWSASTTCRSPTLAYNPLQLAQGIVARRTQSGATGPGQLYLNKNEDAELNTHLPTARDARLAANVANTIAAGAHTRSRAPKSHLAFWGIGAHSKLFGGEILAGVAQDRRPRSLQVIAA